MFSVQAICTVLLALSMLIIFTSSAAIRTNGRHSFDGMEDDRYHPFDLFHMDDKLDDGSMDNNYNSWKFPDGIMLDKRARLPSEAILLGKRRVPAEAVLLGRRDLPNEGILLGR